MFLPRNRQLHVGKLVTESSVPWKCWVFRWIKSAKLINKQWKGIPITMFKDYSKIQARRNVISSYFKLLIFDFWRSLTLGQLIVFGVKHVVNSKLSSLTLFNFWCLLLERTGTCEVLCLFSFHQGSGLPFWPSFNNSLALKWFTAHRNTEAKAEAKEGCSSTSTSTSTLFITWQN